MIFKKLASFFQKKYIRRFPELASILLFAFATIEFAAILSFNYSASEKNLLGLFGYISGVSWYFVFGSMSFLGIAYLYLLSWNWWHKKYHSNLFVHAISYTGTLLSLCLLICLIGVLFPGLNQAWSDLIGARISSEYFPASGFIADFLYKGIPYGNFERLFSLIGTALISSTFLFVFLSLLFDIDIKALFQSFIQNRFKDKKEEPTSSARIKESERKSINQIATQKKETGLTSEIKEIRSFPELLEKPIKPILPLEKKPPQLQVTPSPLAFNSIHEEYPLPLLELLHPPKEVDITNLKKELKEKADLLEETLMSFGIEAKVGQIHCGPTVTMFEVHPAVGVKIGKIKTLENDIALNMEAKSIRIIAPIPGKAAVGIEVPNQLPQEVSFFEVISNYIGQKSLYKIPMLLGKAVNGELVITDLAKMPHCIIAGATGSGKSVCINSIIMSILMLMRPEDIRLLMIDPKKVELTPYTHLPHMLAPVITEPHEAAQALNWLVREMEKRYEILKLTGQRNIDSFNKRKRNIDQEAALPFEIPEKLPYYVAIIDELADLMMVSSQDIETPIARIAQMARAVGIHLILATQRPSREVITGLIKANFPARIAFKVASRVNSQIIIDDIGADTLLGNGDMLFLLPGSSQLIRCQGVYVRDEEINKIIEDITSKRPTQYVIQSFQKQDGSGDGSSSLMGNSDADDVDSLFDTAKNVVFSTGNASTTFLQRKLKIGYARAASIMDQLEMQGIVGPQEGSKPRKIFFPKSETLNNDEDIDIESDSLSAHSMKNLKKSEDDKERFSALRDIANHYPASSHRISKTNNFDEIEED